MDSFDGTVADQYLARVKEVVDYCVDNGMYAIINTHHDEDWEKDTSKIATFEKLWKQIATYFEGYDEHLVFEGMNEVSCSTSDAMTYNQAFVDTVRATGGNNKDRLLICTADSNNTAKALSSHSRNRLPQNRLWTQTFRTLWLPTSRCRRNWTT